MTELTHVRLLKLLSYDPETGYFTCNVSGKPVGSYSDTYTRISIDGCRYKAGRLAWFYMTGTWPEQIDHINGLKGDDRFENLRSVNQSQNSQNRAGFGAYPKGVTFDSRRNKRPWQARLQVNGISKNLGMYATMEEAAEAYKIAAASLHGDYANVR